MNVLYDGIENVEYEYIDWSILDVNVMSMYLIIIEGNYGAIDSGYSARHSYYIIIFSSSLYTLQANLIIYSKFISSGEMVFEGTYYFPININYHYYVSPKIKVLLQSVPQAYDICRRA